MRNKGKKEINQQTKKLINYKKNLAIHDKPQIDI